jgi:hypothetical protein
MPRGPKGEKRPADAIGNAVMIAGVTTGESRIAPYRLAKKAAAPGAIWAARRGRVEWAKKRKEISKKEKDR